MPIKFAVEFLVGGLTVSPLVLACTAFAVPAAAFKRTYQLQFSCSDCVQLGSTGPCIRVVYLITSPGVCAQETVCGIQRFP